MARFYIDYADISADVVALTSDDSAHAIRVLRLTEGSKIEVCDGCNNKYDGTIQSVDPKNVTVLLENCRPMQSEPPVFITLYQAMPKAGKLEFTIQKGVECGISAFVPFYSSRCVVKEREKTARYTKIAHEAAKQCGRGILPTVHNPQSFSEVLQSITKHALVLVAWECEQHLTLKQVLKLNPVARDIALIIGPEGGISPQEIEQLTLQGAKPITLGKRILRTETAGVLAASCIVYELE